MFAAGSLLMQPVPAAHLNAACMQIVSKPAFPTEQQCLSDRRATLLDRHAQLA
jgi:hypothetical protein